MENKNKIYVKIPYSIREKAKSLNAKYDPETKCWYVITEAEKKLFELTNVDVKYDLKDIAKEHGAIWDKENKAWMTCNFNVDNINKLMNNSTLNKLVHKKNELLKDPEIKLFNEISNITTNVKESNKMIFPRY